MEAASISPLARWAARTSPLTPRQVPFQQACKSFFFFWLFGYFEPLDGASKFKPGYLTKTGPRQLVMARGFLVITELNLLAFTLMVNQKRVKRHLEEEWI